MSYEIGQKVRVHLEVHDVDTDALVNATVAVAVVKANLTVLGPAPTVVNDGTGLYHFDVVPDAVAGPWQWTASITGAVTAVQRGQFWVNDPAMNLISLEEIKLHLNKALDSHVDDDELADWIQAAKWVIEREVGPILPRTLTESYDGDRWRRHIILAQGPVISVASVVETWTPGDTRTLTAEGPTPVEDQYVFDASRRMLTRRNSGYPAFWAYGFANIVVTYQVGRYPIPMNQKLALGELVSHLWRSSQLLAGGTRPNVNNPDLIPTGYAVPNRVRELLGRRRGPRLGGR